MIPNKLCAISSLAPYIKMLDNYYFQLSLNEQLLSTSSIPKLNFNNQNSNISLILLLAAPQGVGEKLKPGF